MIDWDRGAELAEDGLHASAIARALGCRPSAVHYWLKRTGIQTAPWSPCRKEANEKIRAAMLMRADGKTLKEVGAAFGVGPERARQMLLKGKRCALEAS